MADTLSYLPVPCAAAAVWTHLKQSSSAVPSHAWQTAPPRDVSDDLQLADVPLPVGSETTPTFSVHHSDCCQWHLVLTADLSPAGSFQSLLQPKLIQINLTKFY